MRTRLALALLLLLAFTIPANADKDDALAVDVEAKQHITFRTGKQVLSRYVVNPDAAKPYLWPVLAPGAVPLTRDWPMVKGAPGESTDHKHQKSMWFCHGDVIPEGIEVKKKKGIAGVDFWSEEEGHGKILCTEVGTPKVEKNHGWVVTKNDWLTSDGSKMMEEKRTIHLYDFGEAYLYVFDIDLHASVCPIIFADTKEGSFGVRIHDKMTEKKGGKLENADGKTGELAIWGQPSAWCDYSGELDGKKVGLAILTDPANAPSCWHSRGYGLMAANPFGRAKSGFPAMKDKTDLVKLDKGAHLKLRFGLLAHTGDAKGGKVDDWYKKFVELGK
jgi:hypothetical protein